VNVSSRLPSVVPMTRSALSHDGLQIGATMPPRWACRGPRWIVAKVGPPDQARLAAEGVDQLGDARHQRHDARRRRRQRDLASRHRGTRAWAGAPASSASPPVSSASPPVSSARRFMTRGAEAGRAVDRDDARTHAVLTAVRQRRPT
jgi:hypothetical protein